MAGTPDYYRVLGISRNATQEEIRSAYFDAARHFHPDMNPDVQAKDKFIALQEAYETLSDSQRRAYYDSQYPEAKPSVAVRVQYSRMEIPRLEEPQLVYALIEYACTSEPDSAKQPPLNLCLVLDRSTSMAGERLDMVKTNVINFVRRLSPHDSISIVGYSDRAELILPKTRVKDIEHISERVSKITTFGGTELYQGLKTGYDQMLWSTHSDEVRYIFLLTDGHTYGDELDCLRLAEEAGRAGIVINTLGIGAEWNDEFLDQLAGLSGGDTTFVSQASDLSKFLDRKLSTLNLVYGKNVVFEYSVPPGIQFRYGIRLMPEVNPLGLTAPLALGNLHYGRRQLLLLEFYLPGTNELDGQVIQLLKGKLRMDIHSEKTTVEFPLNLTRPLSDDASAQLPPSEMIDALSRLNLYRLQEKARSEVDQGKFEQATKHLQHLATHLLAQGDRELAHIVLKEAEHIQQSHHFSREGEKKIKYGTRALLLPASIGESS